MNRLEFSPNNEHNMDQPDPFVKEVHTGDRVRKDAKTILEKKSGNFEAKIKSHEKRAAESKAAWEKILADLPPEEQAAFRCALAQGLEDFYYTHYNAVRNRLDSGSL